MKPKPTIVVQKRTEPVEQPDPVEVRCSCGRRPVYKCNKESGTGYGKMCVK